MALVCLIWNLFIKIEQNVKVEISVQVLNVWTNVGIQNEV